MWNDPVAEYSGKYYSVKRSPCPKPVQKPLPILIGGMGDQLLKITAKHADVANFAWNTPLDTYGEKLKVLKKHCKRYDRDYDSIRKSAGLHLAIEGAEAPEASSLREIQWQRKWEYKIT